MPQCQIGHQLKWPKCREIYLASPMNEPSIELKCCVYSIVNSSHASHAFSPNSNSAAPQSGSERLQRSSETIHSMVPSHPARCTFARQLDCNHRSNVIR